MSRRPSAPPLPPDVQASPIQPPPDDAETAAVMALSDALASTPPPSQEARDAETAATLALADALADEPPRPPADAPFGFDGSAANETGVSLCLGDAAVGAPPGGAMSGEWNEFVLYTFYLGFGHHSWRVRLRFSDAARVFPAAARAAKASGAPLPEPPRKTWTLHEKDASVIDERSRALAAYLERVVARADTWALRDVRAGKERDIPNFTGSSLGRFPLVSADFSTSDHLSEESRSVDAFSGTRARAEHSR